VLLVAEGEIVAGRYRAEAIGADGMSLIDLQGGAKTVLHLK